MKKEMNQKEEEFSNKLQLEKEEHSKELERKNEEISNKNVQIEELTLLVDEYKKNDLLSNMIRDKNT